MEHILSQELQYPLLKEKREDFKFITMIAREKSISKFIVSVIKNFDYVIKNGMTNRNTIINNIVKMLFKDLLNNTHNKIITEKVKESNYPLKE